MPRQRRRRRRPPPSPPAQSATASNPSSTSRALLDAVTDRPWWQPTLGVFIAFFAGLWLGGTASVTDVASGIALVAGAIGTGSGFAHLFGRRLRARKLEQIRRRRLAADHNDPPDLDDGPA